MTDPIIDPPEATLHRFSACHIPPIGVERALLEDFRRMLRNRAIRLEHHQANLELERQKTQDLLQACSSILSPVRRVPPEILRMIFVFALPFSEGPFMMKSRIPSRTEAPLSISHVCSSWRQIAIGTPELWSTLSVVMKKDAIQSDYGAKILGRSGCLPLSLHIECFRGRWLGFDLKNIAPRVETLSLSIKPSQRICKQFLTEPRFQMLEMLTLRFRGRVTGLEVDELYQYGIPPPPPDVLEPLGHAPNLNVLCLLLDFTFARRLDEARFLFPWSQLVHLDVNSIHEMVWPAVISLCPNLRHAGLGINPGWWVGPVEYQPFKETTLHHLESLHLTVLDDLNPAMFFGLFLPNLHELVLEQFGENTNVIAPQPQDTGFSHPTDKLPEILGHTPELDRLLVITNCKIDNILDTLTLNADKPEDNILPKLTDLEFRHARSRLGLDASHKKLTRMLASRLSKNQPRSVSPLKEFSIWAGRSQEDLLEKVRRTAEGDPVEVSCATSG